MSDAGGPSAATISRAAQLACLLEVSAPKPGNVSPGRPFADSAYEDFLASAAAIGLPFASAGAQPLGRTIRAAVEATAQWTRSNTNLGIVLLLAPIAKAAACLSASGEHGHAGLKARRYDSVHDDGLKPRRYDSVHDAGDAPAALRRALTSVLENTSVEDAREVYAAIRLARPGGLGKADAQDVAAEPTATLLEVMRLAADRDGIAREYATAFAVTFECGVPALARARREGLGWEDAIVEAFVTLLARTPDTHVARRAGIAAAEDVSRRAAAALAAGGVRSAGGKRALAEMDRALRDPRNLANPGTTADLTAAALFVVLLAGGWHAAPSADPRRT